MLQKYKGRILISCMLILLPAFVGLFLWERLPEQAAAHWGLLGVDNWANRFFTVFLPPLIFLAAFLLCLYFTLRDPKNKEQSGKALGLIFWLMPVISALSSGILYASAFGMFFNGLRLMPLMMGLTFAVIGNYLPKCRQNQTLGIRVKWALENEENWNATHRVGGRLWVASGILLSLCAFLPRRFVLGAQIVPLMLISFLPPAYSYLYYRRQLKNGTVEKPVPAPFTWKKAWGAALPAVIIVLVFATLFTGSISYEYGEHSFTVHATYWPDRAVEYADIEQLEYRDTNEPGTRTNGYGSPRLLMGTFANDEFGFYTRYSYTQCPSCVVLMVDGQALVLTGKNTEETKALYNALLAHLA